LPLSDLKHNQVRDGWPNGHQYDQQQAITKPAQEFLTKNKNTNILKISISQKGATILANHKSAVKRAKQNVVKNLRNKANRTRVKSVVKAVRAAVDEKSSEKARLALAAAVPEIAKAAKKGAVHRKNASRKISRLTRRVNALGA